MAGDVVAEKIFIGGIPFNLDENDLRRHFEKYGSISDLFMVRDRETRKSKGYAFIQYEDASEAQAAIDAMNDQDLGGRKVNVRHATSNKRDGSGGSGGRFGGNRGGFRGGPRGGRGGNYEGGGYFGSGYGSGQGHGSYVPGYENYGQSFGGYGQTGYGHAASGYDVFGQGASNYPYAHNPGGYAEGYNYGGSATYGQSNVGDASGQSADNGISKT